MASQKVQDSLACTQPSWHRRQLLRVAKMLSKEDVDEITYLAEDFLHPSEAARISTGLDLMRCLEWHGRVGPGNYGYLLSCLREIGRIDIEMSFLKSASSIPFTPHSFGAMSQMLATKMSVLLAKRRQYAANMKMISRVASSQTLWTGKFNEKYPVLCMCLSNYTPPAESDAMELLIPTLHHVFSGSAAWIEALENLKLHQSSTKIVESMKRAGKHFKMLSDSWDSINWTKQWRKQMSIYQQGAGSIGSMSGRACSFFHDLSSELLWTSSIQNETATLSNTLVLIEFISYVTAFGYNIVNWLMLLCELVVTTHTSIAKHKPHLKSILSQYAHVVSSSRPVLEQIFQGTAVLDRMEEEGLLGGQDSETATKQTDDMFMRGYTVSMLVSLPVTLLVLLNSDAVTPSDWELVHTRLLEYFKEHKQAFCQFYVDVILLVMHALQSELEHFRDRLVAIAGTECTPGMQTLAMELLQC